MKTNWFSACALYFLPLALTGCSSTPTKWDSPKFRVLVDPDVIDAHNYVRIEHALINTGKLSVVDRGRGFRAIKKEQERIHKIEPGRYDRREKWAWWAKLYSVRSVIVPAVQCRMQSSFWHRDRVERKCLQSLQLFDANTGEALISIETENSAPLEHDLSYIVPDWEESAEGLVKKLEEQPDRRYFTEEVRLYQDISEEKAIRQEEVGTHPHQNGGSLLLAPHEEE